MTDYCSNSFDQFKTTPEYLSLHTFLHSHDNIIRMVTASELGRPAVEAIQSRLAEKFPNEIEIDNFKRWTGRVVREVMVSQGYVNKPNPKKLLTNPNNKFKTGGYYQK